MAELKRLLSSRRGYRAHLTKLLQAVTEILIGAQPLSEANTAALKDLHEQLERKKELISSLDARILEATTEDSEIEAEPSTCINFMLTTITSRSYAITFNVTSKHFET